MGVLFLMLIVIPILEIVIFIQLGGLIGLAWTLFGIVATAAIGAVVIRIQGLQVISETRAAMARNQPPVRQLFDGICLVIAGALLMTPGFLTDAIGFLLLIPPVRGWIGFHGWEYLKRRGTVRMSMGASFRGGPGSPGPGGRTGAPGDTIDADYTVAEDRPGRGGEGEPPAIDPDTPPVDESRWGRRPGSGAGDGPGRT